jgi:hypothetical protein
MQVQRRCELAPVVFLAEGWLILALALGCAGQPGEQFPSDDAGIDAGDGVDGGGGDAGDPDGGDPADAGSELVGCDTTSDCAEHDRCDPCQAHGGFAGTCASPGSLQSLCGYDHAHDPNGCPAAAAEVPLNSGIEGSLCLTSTYSDHDYFSVSLQQSTQLLVNLMWAPTGPMPVYPDVVVQDSAGTEITADSVQGGLTSYALTTPVLPPGQYVVGVRPGVVPHDGYTYLLTIESR